MNSEKMLVKESRLTKSWKPVARLLFGGRLRRLFWFFWFALAVVLGGIWILARYIYYPAPNASRSDKRVILFGWHTPKLQDMPQYMEATQKLPFDGVVLDIATADEPLGLSWTLFSNKQIDQSLLDEVAAQMRGFKWGRLTDNFLLVTVYPATVDWFEDFEPVLHNLEAVARLAHELGFAGIMLDTEQYSEARLFDYQNQKYREQRTYSDYDAQTYQRGQEVMQALNRGFPGITVIYTFGLTLGSQPDAPRDLAVHPYGLLMPFVEGMIATADQETLLVDGFEGAYIFRDELQFLYAYKLIKGITRDAYARNPARYGEKVRAGFGLWLDHNECDEPSLTPTNCLSGFTPETFRQAMQYALRYTDRYVWIFSRGVKWFTGEGIPPEWDSALLSFRQ